MSTPEYDRITAQEWHAREERLYQARQKLKAWAAQKQSSGVVLPHSPARRGLKTNKTWVRFGKRIRFKVSLAGSR